VIQPGHFHTEFLDGTLLSVHANAIDDDSAMTGADREAKVISQNQAGDSARRARAAINLAGGLEAPLRMPFGGDTVAAAEAKHSFAAGERISRASRVETGLANTRRSGVCRM
jgi:hypothetical protein